MTFPFDIAARVLRLARPNHLRLQQRQLNEKHWLPTEIDAKVQANSIHLFKYLYIL
jgi:hypothetical protein